MPKIEISDARPDKAETARQRAIWDCMYIQDYPKMYINEKKQLQNYVKIMYDLGYYEKCDTIFNLCDKIEKER